MLDTYETMSSQSSLTTYQPNGGLPSHLFPSFRYRPYSQHSKHLTTTLDLTVTLELYLV
jgi:hypothetical protein